MNDISKGEQEFKDLLVFVSFAPGYFLGVTLLFLIGAVEWFNVGVVLFFPAVGVFLGAITVSKRVSLKTAKRMALGGVALLIIEGVCFVLVVRELFRPPLS